MDAGGGGKSGVKADINVTPLVDIVLVLLIIFIVITPAVNNAVRLPLSKHSMKPEAQAGAKYLTLILPAHRDPKTGVIDGPAPIMVDDKDAKDAKGNALTFTYKDDAKKAQLVGYIKTSMQYLSDRRVFIKADADIPFKHVDELFQICREGGADEASVVTSEDKSTGDKGGK
jgi:biopolymer transport protein ExbD